MFAHHSWQFFRMTCLDVFVEGQALHLVMPFMDTDLKKIIEDQSVQLTELHIACLAKQVLQGLQASRGELVRLRLFGREPKKNCQENLL